jgi:hypothetical protein
VARQSGFGEAPLGRSGLGEAGVVWFGAARPGVARRGRRGNLREWLLVVHRISGLAQWLLQRVATEE